jgi:hypothetical protein
MLFADEYLRNKVNRFSAAPVHVPDSGGINEPVIRPVPFDGMRSEGDVPAAEKINSVGTKRTDSSIVNVDLGHGSILFINEEHYHAAGSCESVSSGLFLTFPRANEAKIPAKQSTVKTMQAIRMLCMNRP